MLKRLWNVMIVSGILTTAACAVDAVESVDDTPEPATHEVSQTVESIERPTLVFERKPFWSSWNNFCEALNGFEVRVTVAGCTTSQVHTNCSAGTTSGTCRCDVTTSRSGTC